MPDFDSGIGEDPLFNRALHAGWVDNRANQSGRQSLA